MTIDKTKKLFKKLENKFYFLKFEVNVNSETIKVIIRKNRSGYEKIEVEGKNFAMAFKEAFQEARQIGWVKNTR